MKFFLLRQAWKRLTNNRGFTLIELGVVITLIMLLASISSIVFRVYNRQLVHAEASTLFMQIGLLQRQAITSGKEQTLTIDVDQHAYTTNNTIHRLNHAVRFGFMPAVYGPPSHPVTLITQPTTFEKHKIVAQPNGTLSAGTVYLTDQSNRCLYAITIGVAKKQYIRLYRYSTQWIEVK